MLSSQHEQLGTAESELCWGEARPSLSVGFRLVSCRLWHGRLPLKRVLVCSGFNSTALCPFGTKTWTFCVLSRGCLLPLQKTQQEEV